MTLHALTITPLSASKSNTVVLMEMGVGILPIMNHGQIDNPANSNTLDIYITFYRNIYYMIIPCFICY